MNTILVPTDGSIAAEKALDVALDLAEKHDADVKLFHVLLRDKEPEELLTLPDLAVSQESVAQELSGLVNSPKAPHSAEELMSGQHAPDHPVSEDLLQNIGAHVLQRASLRAASRGIKAEVLPCSDGAAASAIVSMTKSEAIDTIVMGTRGLRQIEAVAFGSVSQEVCRSVDCTCIAVH